jgi:hypothetical protein
LKPSSSLVNREVGPINYKKPKEMGISSYLSNVLGIQMGVTYIRLESFLP